LSGQVGGLARVPPVGGPAPLVDFGLLRSRTFGFGSLAALTFALVPPSFFFVLALYLQQGRQLTALFSGVVFTAVGVGFFAAMLGHLDHLARPADPVAGRAGRGGRLPAAGLGGHRIVVGRAAARARGDRVRDRHASRGAPGGHCRPRCER